MAQTADQTRGGGDDFALHLKRDQAPAFRDYLRAHLDEMPQNCRNAVQSQINNWEIGQGNQGGTQSGGARHGERSSDR